MIFLWQPNSLCRQHVRPFIDGQVRNFKEL